MIDKISVNGDSRVRHCTAVLNGTTYGYLLSLPEGGQYKSTVFLIHGFPDLSMGWRYQIPALTKMGLRVVAPDCMGYGRTDAPEFSEEIAARYGLKQCADDMKELARQLGSSQIILGGHDWGGFAVYRIALYHPGFVTHLFSICTPYNPPSSNFIPLETIVKTKVPYFGYQLQFVSGDLEKVIRSKSDIRQFLLSMYGGRTSTGEFGFDVFKGVLLDKFQHLQNSKVISEEELNYYVNEWARHGIHGPLNWYRTREQNYRDELGLLGRPLDIPVLFILATQDQALRPALSRNMSKYVPNLTTEEVKAGHWAHWQVPGECNEAIRRWMEGVVFTGKSKL
ncbi:epoxide hydrolase [Paracoccidioides lutzii Pb01]|uniref:Epoxide hydrolase n=1 Tax=Paracoccidioides lutzii (strain ATCC MYA-826 / Pb01) TaxID=502779 RepID=C1H726_PARBA|nr:epoxide hydrolase [Paracoccidioides lutzii Pb01]EEH35520.1 epoxide hydrolase [Paracoccidioides lutzii Pb01]